MQKNFVTIVFFTLVLVGIGYGIGNSNGVNKQKAAQLDSSAESGKEVIDIALVKDAYKRELERVTGKTYTAKVVRLEGFQNVKVELKPEGATLRQKVATK